VSTDVAGDEPSRVWRLLVGLAGVVSFVGGGLHPQAPDGLSFRDSLAAMMADGSWVLGHALLGVGSALALGGLLAVRRAGAWPAAGAALPFAVVAAAILVDDRSSVEHQLEGVDGLPSRSSISVWRSSPPR